MRDTNQRSKYVSRKSGTVRKIALSVVFTLSLFVFLFSLYQIVCYFAEENDQKKINESIIDLGIVSVPVEQTETAPESIPPVTGDAGDASPAPTVTSKVILKKPDIEVNFDKLKQIYPDLVGWLYMQGGTVHYPVMQGKDNDYYLNRLPDGKTNAAGSLFLDSRDSADCSQPNQVIYGHNMKNGSMFAFLLNYRDSAYYESNPYLFYFTQSGVYRAEIFAGIHTKSTDYVYARPQNEEEMTQYLSEMRRKSVFSSSVSVSGQDRVLVLSTCSGAVGSDDRFVVLAKLVTLD